MMNTTENPVQIDIRLRSLAHRDRHLLGETTLSVHPGDKILIVGATGSGKTSLLHTLNLTNPAFEGSIEFMNRDIRDYRPEELRARVMEVMQEPHLDDGAVRDALLAPWQYHIHRKKDKSGLQNRMDEISRLLIAFGLDDGYLDKNCAKLSGGEKQRVALVRAMQFHPEVLLLDEISSALDQTSSGIISDCLLEHYSGTIIAISHDPLWQHRWRLLWRLEGGAVSVERITETRS